MRKTILLALASIMMFSCVNDVKENNFTDTERKLYSILPDSYAEIGNKHNEMLSDFYFGEENRLARASGTNYKNLSIEAYFGDVSVCYNFRPFSVLKTRNAVEEGNSVAQEMVDLDLISEEAGEYIAHVEAVLDNLPDSLEEAKDAISVIELDYLESSDGSILPEFISYAETAKASLEFWSENLELLEGSSDDVIGRWSLKSLWNKYKHRLKMMSASDAAGAAAGAVFGATIGFAGGGAGAAPGAVIGAALAGAVSSVQGFKNDCICVVVPVGMILERM